jgi:hypothetical protein
VNLRGDLLDFNRGVVHNTVDEGTEYPETFLKK